MDALPEHVYDARRLAQWLRRTASAAATLHMRREDLLGDGWRTRCARPSIPMRWRFTRRDFPCSTASRPARTRTA